MAQWCSARIARHEACRVLPDTHVLRGVFPALDIYPTYAHSVLNQFCISGCLSTEKSTMAREHTHAFASTNRSRRTSLCQLSFLYGTGHNNSPNVSHRNSFEAVNKPLFKLCSLLSIFLSLLGGSALAKASSSLQDPTFARKTRIFRAEAGAETCRRRVAGTTISAVPRFQETGIQNERGHVGPPYSAGGQHIAAF